MAQLKKKKRFYDVEMPLINKETQLLAYDISELENNKILHNDIEPDLSGKGNVLARRVFSIFGGNDLTFKGKCILKDIAEILSIEPGLVVLLPSKHTELVFEYLKQNLNNKYLDIIAIYNQKEVIK